MSQSKRGVPLFETSLDSFHYTDTGCEVAPSCLTCPLPLCKEEDPGIVIRQKREELRRRISVLRTQGLNTKAIAAHLGMTQRAVLRAGADKQDTP